MVAALCEEVRDPQREVPKAMGESLVSSVSSWVSILTCSSYRSISPQCRRRLHHRSGLSHSSQLCAYPDTRPTCGRIVAAYAVAVQIRRGKRRRRIWPFVPYSWHLAVRSDWILDGRFSMHLVLFSGWRYSWLGLLEESEQAIRPARQCFDPIDHRGRALGADLSWIVCCFQRFHWW